MSPGAKSRTARTRRSVAVVLVVLALAGTSVAAAGAAPTGGQGTPGVADTGQAPPSEPVVDADATIITVELQADGSATWRIEYFLELESQNDSEAWNDLQSDVESNPSEYTDRFASRIRSTVDAAENETGRSMTARNFTVATRTQPNFGVLVYEFTWDGFAVVDGDRLLAGDAIDRFYMDSSTRLVMLWPSDYERVSVSPQPDDTRSRAVVWKGSDTDFVAGEPRLVVSSAATATTTSEGSPGPGETTSTVGGGGPGDGDTTEAPAQGGSGLLTPLVFGLLGLLVVGALAAYGYRQRGARGGGDGDGAPAAAAGDGGDGAAGAAAAGAAGAGEAVDDGDEGEPEPPSELLSNEERVLQLVEDHGGRMKQQEIVDALDWTEAKTSQVVRGLRDDGELDGFRLGRENVLKLPSEGDEIDEP
jgi:hypothetical protein